MEKPKQLSYIDQLCLLKLRGITGINIQISGMNNSKSGIKKEKNLIKIYILLNQLVIMS